MGLPGPAGASISREEAAPRVVHAPGPPVSVELTARAERRLSGSKGRSRRHRVARRCCTCFFLMLAVSDSLLFSYVVI